MTVTWRVLLPQSIDPAGPTSIADFATCTGMDEYESTEAALADIGRYDAVIVRVAELDADVIDSADQLKIISKHGAGLDNVNVDVATECGIAVCNTPGANARSVAEHAIALLFGVHRHLCAADAHVRAGGWDRAAYAGHELTGDTLGLFGFGAIARETADLAHGVGLSVATYDPYVSDDEFPDDVEKVDELEELFCRADAVSVHVPLTDATHHAVSTAELQALGSEGVLVNTSRGPVVDEDALLAALGDGTIAGAGLDVFEEEPPTFDSAVCASERILLSPHIGGVTDAAMERMSQQAAANVRTVYEGELPASTVNREPLGREVAE